MDRRGSRRTPALLFVAGEPNTGPNPMQDVSRSVFDRLGTAMIGDVIMLRTGTKSGPAYPTSAWHLSAWGQQCRDLVLSVAADLGRPVTVIDVNRDDAPIGVVQHYVGPNDLLPLLVRADGQRLEGHEQFTPRRVRRFLAAPDGPGR
jgi:hypothetical protein